MAGNIHHIEVNPLIAARSGDAQNQGSKGTDQPPVIRNFSEIDQSDGPARRIIGLEDGATNYVMTFWGWTRAATLTSMPSLGITWDLSWRELSSWQWTAWTTPSAKAM